MADSTALLSVAPPSDLIPLREVCKILNVHPNTLRLWGDNGTLPCYRLGPTGMRRWERSAVLAYAYGDIDVAAATKILLYARVSTLNQARNNKEGQSQLSRQLERLRQHAKEKFPNVPTVEYQDCASSMNWSRPGLNRMLAAIMA